jgi:SAM-dependent methyltransferase
MNSSPQQVRENDPTRRGGYDPQFFERLAEIEDRHFWFVARNDLLCRLTRELIADLQPGFRVLEVGCGNGNVLRFLERVCTNGSVIGIDRWMEGLVHARRRTSCSLVQGDLRKSPFAGGFDIVGMFDVLEHLEDDSGTLLQVRSLLAPRGALMLTVPAHEWLWSYFDEAACHCRRYSKSELEKKLKDAGYEVELLTEYMSSTLPFLYAGRTVANLRRAGNLRQVGAQELALSEMRILPVLNGIFTLLLKWENRRLTKARSLPVGSSLVAIARRR